VRDPASAFVQSTAASALGFVGRRAAAERDLPAVAAVLAALAPALSMAFAGAMSNGLAAPDLAEGASGPEDPTTVDARHPAATPELIAFPADGVMPRSAAREMAAYALVMVSSAAAASGASADDAATWAPTVQLLSDMAHADLNRWAAVLLAIPRRRQLPAGRSCASHVGQSRAEQSRAARRSMRPVGRRLTRGDWPGAFRFAMGFAAESLRRLSLPGAAGQLASAVSALDAFVARSSRPPSARPSFRAARGSPADHMAH
jgi:hypothetical protein